MEIVDLKENASNSMSCEEHDITREMISNNTNIKLTDHNIEENLSMYCYTQCDNDQVMIL